MAEDQLRSVIETVRARLQAELETHLSALTNSHLTAIAETRQAAAADAERQWSARLQEAHAEWDARLGAETAAVRADVERTMAAEVLRLRGEAEQRAAEAAAQARRELEDAVAAERTRAQADLERAQADLERAQAERERAHADFERAHADLERAQADRERAHAEHERTTADLQRAFGELDRTQSDLQRVQGDFDRAQSDLQRVQTELAGGREDRLRIEAEFTRAQGEVERSRGELQRTQKELAAAQSDLQRLQAELAGARKDRERIEAEFTRAQGEVERSRGELQRTQKELAAAQSDLQRVHVELATAQADVACSKEDVARSRQELQRAQDDLQRLQTALDALRVEGDETRARLERELAEVRNLLQTADPTERAAAVADLPPAAARSSSSGLLGAIRDIDSAPSLSEALAAVVRGAALEAPRVALFIVNGGVLQEWPVDGVTPLDAGQFSADGDEAGFLADVLRTGESKAIDGTNGAAAPSFAGRPTPRRAIAVPFVLGGQPVAVLYGDDGAVGEPLASWHESLQILGRHASACLAHLTAVRTAQAMNLVAAGPGSNGIAPSDDEEHGARRYARLLMSEIKMYNDSAVRAGRERRDLLQRLKPEIERARQLYEQRITPSHARDVYFQQELVQTLADGDHSLLG